MTRKILALCLSILVTSPVFSHGALDPGMANICAYGGMAPSYFGSKDALLLNNGMRTWHTGLRKFHEHFRFPFIFGASAGYSWTDSLDVNLSVDYVTARGDTHVFMSHPRISTNATGNTTFKINTGTFGSLGVYAGAKYYIDCGDCWYPFIGIRGGVQLRRATRATTAVNDIPFIERGPFIHRQTVPAGGVSVGFDGPLTEYVNIFVMGEFNFSGKVQSQNSTPYHVNVRSFRTLPLVIGLRFRAD